MAGDMVTGPTDLLSGDDMRSAQEMLLSTTGASLLVLVWRLGNSKLNLGIQPRLQRPSAQLISTSGVNRTSISICQYCFDAFHIGRSPILDHFVPSLFPHVLSF